LIGRNKTLPEHKHEEEAGSTYLPESIRSFMEDELNLDVGITD
jgi:hypothetical protein